MAHVSEEKLLRYAIDRALVDDAEAIERHLAACAECRDAMESIRLFDAALRDPESWIDAPASPGFEELRRLAENVAAEDAEARELLAEFEDAPAARFAWADLPSNPDYYSGGVVRALCKRANGMCERDPRYALVLAESAIAIAAELPESKYSSAALHEWRGEAWKEQANALHRLGRFPEALEALDHAEEEYGHLKHVGIGHIAVLYVRAWVLYEQDEFERAESLVERSAAEALHLGSIERYMRAQHLKGQILFQKRDLRGAIKQFEAVRRYGEGRGDKLWIAREGLALGNCFIEIGALPEARDNLIAALRHFKAAGMETEVARTEWALARLLFAEGARNDAIYRLRSSVTELAKLGMLTDSAIAAVDLAELLNSVGRTREIPKLMTTVIKTFAQAGRITGALMALAYLKDAAAAGTMTARVTAHVRRFIDRTENQPELLFIPPPL